MSPEQAENPLDVDLRSDIYSLGCTLFFLLTGGPVFSNSSLLGRLLAHRTEPPPQLSAVRNDVPVAMDAIFQRMVAKSPNDRFALMVEVVTAFDALNRPQASVEPTQTVGNARQDDSSSVSMPGGKSGGREYSSFIRVQIDHLDDLMNLVGEGELTRKIKTLATVAIRVGVAPGVAQQTLGSRDKAPAVGQAVPDSMARSDSMTGHRQAQPDLPHQRLSKPTSPAQQGLSSRPAIRTAEIVAIATSTGGPNALASLLSSLPPSFLTPIVVVQHMASGFTATLAESLRRQTGRNVREVDGVQSLDAAEVWIAPGGRHLVVTHRGRTIQVASHDAPPENGCCPSADVLFRSVVDVFGSRCLAVVLTGMGCDGLAGCRAIRQAGGTILVQDEASSIAWGMPGQVATAGLADDVLPLTDLAQEICRRTVHTPAWRAGRHPPPNEAALPNL